MSAFKACLLNGQKGEAIISAFIDNKYEDDTDYLGVDAITSIKEQKTYGDLKVLFKDTEHYIEVKTDSNSTYGNLFIEKWSNMNQTKGWLYGYDKVNYLCYIFEDVEWMLMVKWKDLQKFVLDSEAVWRERPQRKFNQPNVSVGYTVPYERVFNEVPSAKKISLKNMGE